jgi:FKBP-type peptidyl-prolyl cis-trans isomerase
MIVKWKMLSNAFLIFTCLLSISIRNYAIADNVAISNYQHILASLSEEDKLYLHEFLWTILTEYECGYVLYGKKPICFMGYASIGNHSVGMMKHYSSAALQNGIKTWRKLGLKFESAGFMLHESKCSNNIIEECNKILLINKKHFIDTVNENLTLFQYILGPKVTAKALLNKLTGPNSNEGMNSVLKNNKVLIGIVLGFGVKNALLVNRQELISAALFKYRIDLDSEDVSRFDEILQQDPSLEISFDNPSLFNEFKDLDERICLSSKCLEMECPRLFFGCIPEDKDTIALINHYEDVQLKIIKVLESKNFVTDVLDKFYGHETKPLTAYQTTFEKNKTNLSSLFTQNKYLFPSAHLNSFTPHLPPFDLVNLVAYSIWNQFCDLTTVEERNEYPAFIEGMRAAEQTEDALFEAYLGELNRKPWSSRSPQEQIYSRGYKIWAHYKIGKDLFSLKEVVRALDQNQKNKEALPIYAVSHHLLNKLHQYLYRKHHQKEIDTSDRFFKNLNILQFNQRCILSRCDTPIFYLPQKQGTGRSVLENDKVMLRYRMKNSTGHVILDSGSEGDVVDLQRSIPGLRFGLTGLREGSKGILYLHSQLGFRDNSMRPPIRPFLQVGVEILNICQ